MGARQNEHAISQTQDIARRSTRSKADGPAPIHPGMSCPTRSGGPGGPTQGRAPDASSPNVTDPSRPGKSFAVPGITRGMTSNNDRGRYDPGLAEAVMGEAHRAPDDYARDLHAVLPGAVQED
jgi:hypothetical protein